MASDHAEIWIQPTPAAAQDLKDLVQTPELQENVASSDLLLLGMIMWMEQGLVLDLVLPPKDKEKRKPDDVI